MKTLIIALFISLGLFCTQAQELTTEKIAILPLNSNVLDLTSIQTAESILRIELGRISNWDIVSEKRTIDAMEDQYCNDKECAQEIGEKLGASRVLVVNLNSLGDKIIVQYFLVETSSGKSLLTDQTTAHSVEDLESVMKRMALSVVNLTPFAKNAEVGNIVAQESKELLQRTSRKNIGLFFGYLFPHVGYHEDLRKSFVLDFRWDYELPDYAVGMMLGARYGFAANIYGQYLFTKTDVTPFVGGAFGFHWVSHHDFFSSDKDGDGFELTLSTGLRLFRTYNFQVLLNLDYLMTFNDYNDKAVVFTLGLLR